LDCSEGNVYIIGYFGDSESTTLEHVSVIAIFSQSYSVGKFMKFKSTEPISGVTVSGIDFNDVVFEFAESLTTLPQFQMR
jgi:hypothetical protein